MLYVILNLLSCDFYLSQRLEQRHRMETELRQRIEQLEKRQMQDDAVLNVVNRYWNQLNEDIRVLLQRFDAETADESENKSKKIKEKNYSNDIACCSNKMHFFPLQMRVRLPPRFLCNSRPGIKKNWMIN